MAVDDHRDYGDETDRLQTDPLEGLLLAGGFRIRHDHGAAVFRHDLERHLEQLRRSMLSLYAEHHPEADVLGVDAGIPSDGQRLRAVGAKA